MELQNSVNLHDYENALQSITRSSKAFLVIKNGSCDLSLSKVPHGVSVYHGDKGESLISNILSSQYKYDSESNPGFDLIVEFDSLLKIEEPLYVIFLDSDSANRKKVCRNCYLMGDNSQVTIIEKQLSEFDNDNQQTLNMFSSWFLGKNTSLAHYGFELPNKVPNLSIYNNISVRQMEGSSCCFFSFYWEQGTTNNNIEVALNGEFSNCKFFSASLLSKSAIVNNNIRVNHNAPNCESLQIYKGVYNDNSSSKFDSLVYVKQDAQKTSSTQQNNNIILSDYASVKSNPQLEIFADDVKCAHGSTIGQIDTNALFYLQSRGIGKKAGTAILLQGFFGDIINEVADPKLRSLVIKQFNKALNINRF